MTDAEAKKSALDQAVAAQAAGQAQILELVKNTAAATKPAEAPQV